MRVFINKWFSKFARKQQISTEDLIEIVNSLETGKVDADLGGGVVKQRLARTGGGKSGGFRSVIIFRRGDRAIFVYAFAKNDVENISKSDMVLFKKLAATLLSMNAEDLGDLVKDGQLEEISYEEH